MREVFYSTEHLANKVGKKQDSAPAPAHSPLWEKHRELMRQLTLGVDIAFLHNLPEWSRAESVLEIGAGKGKFLEALLDYFPEKEYVGLELGRSKDGDSTTRHRAGTISIVKSTLSELSAEHVARYDIIFIHSYSSHIAVPHKFLKHVYQLLKPGGSLIIYEMNDEKIAFRPDPGFTAFFDELPGLRDALSPTHCHWKDMVRVAASCGYSIRANSDVLFPSSYGDNKRHLGRIVAQLLELAETSDVMEWNFAAARRALQRWSSDPSSFGQFGIRRIVLRRPGGLLRMIFNFLFRW